MRTIFAPEAEAVRGADPTMLVLFEGVTIGEGEHKVRPYMGKHEVCPYAAAAALGRRFFTN
jgi:hypothetical protein